MQNDKEKFKKAFIERLINFSVIVFRLCQEFQRDYLLMSICQQLIKSSTSIGANVVEAKASSSRRDYIKFLEIALKSANETKYWLIVISAIKPEFEIEIKSLMSNLSEIAKILASSILTLKNKK